MKRALTVLTFVLLAMPAAQAASPAPQETMPVFTWGVRAGFAANSTYVTNAFIDGHSIEEYQQDTQLGNFAALQLRVNARRLFLQTGMGISLNKSTFSIDRNSWNPESESASEMELSYSLTSMTLPLQLGCHIINSSPYSMSVFTGPRFRIPFHDKYMTEFSGIAQEGWEEDITNIIPGWTLGLAIQIGRSFFDFEYEYGIRNISEGFHPVAAETPDPGIILNRRMGIMSFSFGIMF